VSIMRQKVGDRGAPELDEILMHMQALVPRGGSGPSLFRKPFIPNKMAVSLEYKRLSNFATEPTDSTVSFGPIEFPVLQTP
jgi:hypothetical protein